jgi:hypothetical protein
MELFVETHVRSDDRQKGCSGSSTTELNTLWYVGFQPFFFLSYYLLEFDDFIFYFQGTYNNRLNDRYEDDLSTQPDSDPDLWLEAGSSGGPHIN